MAVHVGVRGPGHLARVGGAAASLPFSTDAQQFLDRLFTAPTDSRASLYAALFDGLASDGVLAKLDGLRVAGVYAGDDLTNLINGAYDASIATLDTNPDFLANQGYLGVGLNKNVQEAFNPATVVGAKYAQNDACLFGFSLTATASNALFVGADSTGNVELVPLWSDGKTYWGINSSAEVGSTLGLGTAAGFWLMNRTASNLQKLYRDAVEVASSSTASAAPTSHNIYAPFGAYRLACIGYGKALTTGDITNLNTRIRAYLTGIGTL